MGPLGRKTGVDMDSSRGSFHTDTGGLNWSLGWNHRLPISSFSQPAQNPSPAPQGRRRSPGRRHCRRRGRWRSLGAAAPRLAPPRALPPARRPTPSPPAPSRPAPGRAPAPSRRRPPSPGAAPLLRLSAGEARPYTL